MAHRVTVNDLLDALRKYGNPEERRPEGKGWMSIAEMAVAEKTTKTTIKARINNALKRGIKIQQAKGTAKAKDGRVQQATYYRLGNGTR